MDYAREREMDLDSANLFRSIVRCLDRAYLRHVKEEQEKSTRLAASRKER